MVYCNNKDCIHQAHGMCNKTELHMKKGFFESEPYVCADEELIVREDEDEIYREG